MLATSIQVGQYDLVQIDKYIYQLEKDNTIVKDGVGFRIFFVASMLSDYAKSQLALQMKIIEILFYIKNAI